MPSFFFDRIQMSAPLLLWMMILLAVLPAGGYGLQQPQPSSSVSAASSNNQATTNKMTLQVCQNKDCCQNYQGSINLVRTMTDLLLPSANVRIEESGCLSKCDKGPNVCLQGGRQLVQTKQDALRLSHRSVKGGLFRVGADVDLRLDLVLIVRVAADPVGVIFRQAPDLDVLGQGKHKVPNGFGPSVGNEPSRLLAEAAANCRRCCRWPLTTTPPCCTDAVP